MADYHTTYSCPRDRGSESRLSRVRLSFDSNFSDVNQFMLQHLVTLGVKKAVILYPNEFQMGQWRKFVGNLSAQLLSIVYCVRYLF